MSFTVALTADGARNDGSTVFGDIGIERLDASGIAWRVLSRDENPIPVRDLSGVNAVLAFGHARFDAGTVDALPELMLIARFGAGYETIDLADCTAAGVAVTNTPDAVRRPVALAALTLTLSLAHNVHIKDRLVRTARWADRSQFRGRGVRDRVLGILGLGGIGLELAALASGVGFTVIGANRSGRSDAATRLGVEVTTVDDVVRRSDYVVLCASLNPESRHLMDERRLRLMKPGAYLVNVSRGALVDESALATALQDGRIAGAALDVFETEPLAVTSPLIGLENVILTPHSAPWTDEFTEDVATAAIDNILAVARGEVPRDLLNPDVIRTPAWQRKKHIARAAAVAGDPRRGALPS